MKYVLADGMVLGDEVIHVGDVFNITERYARPKDIKIIWERRPNMLVESVETELKIVDIELMNQHFDFAEPNSCVRLVLEGKDNIRSNDILLIKQ